MKKKILEQEVKPQWMVLSRHFGSPGGIWDYGEGMILDFFDSFEKADKFAKEYFVGWEHDLVEPRVWVLCCDKTYVRAKEGLACVISKVKR